MEKKNFDLNVWFPLNCRDLDGYKGASRQKQHNFMSRPETRTPFWLLAVGNNLRVVESYGPSLPLCEFWEASLLLEASWTASYSFKNKEVDN